MDDTGINIIVVIPSHNTGNFGRSDIESVDRMEDVEVVENGSEDSSFSIVWKYGEEQVPAVDAHCYRSENRGRSSAVHPSHKKARGEYVSILDAGDQIAERGLGVLCQNGTDEKLTSSYPMVFDGV